MAKVKDENIITRVIKKIFLKTPFFLFSLLTYYKNRSYLKSKKIIAIDLVNPNYAWFYDPIVDSLLASGYEIISFGNKYKGHLQFSEFIQPVMSIPLAVISVDAHRFVKKKQHRIIQLFHAMVSFGSIWGDEFITRNDAILLTSPFMANQLNEPYYAKLINDNNVTVYKTGYHKIDDLCIPEKPKSIGRAVLYGPTWHRNFSSIFKWLEPIIEDCKKLNIELFIKLHPYLYKIDDDLYSGSVNWVNRIKELSESYSIPITIVPVNLSSMDMNKLFDRVMFMITDVSSLGSEFVLSKHKPIIYLDDKIKIPLEADSKLFLDFAENKIRGQIGPIVKTPEALSENMERLLNNNPYKENIEHFCETFVYNLGNAKQAVVAAIEDEFNSI